MNTKIFYRFDAFVIDEYTIKLQERTFHGVKETPKGWWIQEYHEVGGLGFKKRWVSKTAKKRFAYPNKMEALESFRLRKKRQLEIPDSRKYIASEAMKEANKMIQCTPICEEE